MFTEINDDLKEWQTFKWWKKRQRKRYLRIALLIIVLEMIVCGCVLIFPMQYIEEKDIVFGGVSMALFLCLAVYFIYKCLKITSLNPTDVINVIVVEKSRFSKKRLNQRENRAYYLTAFIDGKQVEGLCEVETYRVVQVGDPAIFFRMDSKQYFAIHLNEEGEV